MVYYKLIIIISLQISFWKLYNLNQTPDLYYITYLEEVKLISSCVI